MVSSIRQLVLCTAVGLLLFGLIGCSHNVVTESGIYYNRGLEQAYNHLLLANIIRSAKGMPTYFSAVGDYSGSTDRNVDGNLSISSTLDQLQSSELDFGFEANSDLNRNANVSSLETEAFVQAMLTPLDPKLFFLLAEGHARQRFDLLSVLVVKWVLIPESTVADLRDRAIRACKTEIATFPRSLQMMCANFPSVVAGSVCAGEIGNRRNRSLVFSSDPTNLCSHARFRLLVEAITILQPALLRRSAAETVTLLAQEQNQKDNAEPSISASKTTAQKPAGTRTASSASLVFGNGTNFALRSPNEILQYLGASIQARHSSGATPSLTGPGGRDMPVFDMIIGEFDEMNAIGVRILGKSYFLKSHPIGGHPDSFSLRVLAILKDIISINTSQNTLPKSPTVFIQ